MKGVLITFISTLILSVSAFAQHTDVVVQSGNNNNSSVEQSFMSSPGPGLPGNEAYVDQIGDDNQSEIDQLNGGFAGDEHWAKVYSGGNGNNVMIFQERSAGDADVFQLGNNNRTEVYQSGNFYSSTAYTPGIDAVAYSIGDNNDLVETIWGTNATAYSYQLGNSNHIDQFLGSDYGEKVQNSNFETTQLGDANNAVQIMEGEGWAGGIIALDNFGSIYSAGNDNIAVQHMLEGIFPAAANNSASAYQGGNTNISEQYQTGASNTSTHTQIGNTNASVTVQN